MTDLTKVPVSNLTISVFYNNCKTRSSFCWKYFGHLVLNEDYKKKKILNSALVYCSACLNAVKATSDDVAFGAVKIKCYNKTVSTGNLMRHLRDDHQIKDDSVDTEKKSKDSLSFTRAAKTTNTASSSTIITKHEKWVIARDLAVWFCKSLLPFDSVSDDGMVDFFKKYNIIGTDAEFPSRSTVSQLALDDVYGSALTAVKENILLDAADYTAMTFDLWTDKYRRLNYVTLTLHYLTSDFNLKTFNLSTGLVDGKECGEKIESILKDVITQFRLNNKIIHAVTDAGENVKKAVSQVGLQHHLCLGHGFHTLVTVDGVKKVPALESLVIKCKEIVKAVRYRLPELEVDAKKVQRQFLDSLDSVADALEVDDSDPIPDDLTDNVKHDEESKDSLLSLLGNVHYIPSIKTTAPTRWHSIIEMLESFIQVCNRDPINNMLRKIGQDELKITPNEWNILEDYVKFLRRFRDVVATLSSQKTCTMNVTLVFRCEIIDILKSVEDEESLIMSQLKQNMLANIDKRFPITSTIVAAALLDYRFMGLKEIDLYLESKNLTRSSFLTSYIKKTTSVFDAMAQSNDNVEDPLATTSSDHTSLLYKLAIKHSSTGTGQSQDNKQHDPIDQECWRYVATADPTEPKDGNLLSFWNSKKNVFPRLSVLAKALLCVPATNTPCERVFSIAGLNITDKRSRLNSTRLNKIVFIHDNYKSCKIAD